jgi:hypothetical protein
MSTIQFLAAACIAFAPVVAVAGDLDKKGWEALSAVISAPDEHIARDRCEIAVTVDYDRYIEHMGEFRKAWLYMDKPLEYYQRRSYQILLLLGNKEATLLTQAFFDPRYKTGMPPCHFRIFVAGHDEHGKDKSFLVESWSFSSKVASKVNWDKLEDKDFPSVAIDDKFGPEFERRLRRDPAP